MCKPATCANCGKSSWWGCGNHVSAVMDSKDKSTWCTCEPKAAAGVFWAKGVEAGYSPDGVVEKKA
ncbi:uncharacterized protein DNG_00213 [Cephalotrichum gorgonifer]|uniref:Uncharacterized protein n=1 Tax=Cephalotrichum gorgonifer TaxID=2041049 RepID=A0AAE8SQK1_9PEZI|nr:uncharacterized protein DNG_00213 [Cephalotrichum gorgonifer]